MFDWYDWLINYIPEPITKSVGRVKDQNMIFLKIKDYSKPDLVKTVYRGGKKRSEEYIIKDRIVRPFLNKKMIIINQQE